jgi:hypothetical protein
LADPLCVIHDPAPITTTSPLVSIEPMSSPNLMNNLVFRNLQSQRLLKESKIKLDNTQSVHVAFPSSTSTAFTPSVMSSHPVDTTILSRDERIIEAKSILFDYLLTHKFRNLKRTNNDCHIVQEQEKSVTTLSTQHTTNNNYHYDIPPSPSRRLSQQVPMKRKHYSLGQHL